jgi:ubiquitin C-terminal hydrolase
MCRCPSCNIYVEATKQQTIWRASDVVIVQLKRFGNSGVVSSRIDAFVNVPLEAVDFTPYFAPTSPFRGGSNTFRLYAVTNHTGR